MSSIASKSQRNSDIKNLLVDDLYRLRVDSEDLIKDLRIANEDIVLMFKSMEDRQSELLSRSLLNEEKFGQITAMMKEGKPSTVPESSSANVEVPPAYSGNVRKLVDDSCLSLNDHAKMYKELVEDMEKSFNEYVEIWEKKFKEFKEHANDIKDASFKLDRQLSDFKGNI